MSTAMAKAITMTTRMTTNMNLIINIAVGSVLVIGTIVMIVLFIRGFKG